MKLKFFRILLIKAYFDKGWGLTHYFKYLYAFAGIFDFINQKTAIITGIIYILCCFIIGFIWYQFGIIETENEISNIFNPFQREVREKLNGERFK